MSISQVSENIPIAPLTKFGVGGAARFFIEAETDKDVANAVVFAHDHALQLFPLGEGSNILVPDAGINGVVLKMSLRDIQIEEDGDDTLFIIGAGLPWEKVVDEAASRGIFGIENLAGIPGSMGGAAVQNIGAYGSEFSDTFEYADGIDSATGTQRRINRVDASFAYRTSVFKKNRAFIITRVALRLTKQAIPNTAYADLEKARADGIPLTSPIEVVRAIRFIRARKFPQGTGEGTAGSFFKNPVLSREEFEEFIKRFPDVPAFPQKDGTIKIALAWLLDHGLSLRGFSLGRARLYEKQPLVIVASAGACAAEIDVLATEVARQVFAATGIHIEREVEMFGSYE